MCCPTGNREPSCRLAGTGNQRKIALVPRPEPNADWKEPAMRKRIILTALFLTLTQSAFGEELTIPERTYRGELVQYPGPWAYEIPKSHIILVSDEEVRSLADPDKEMNLSLGHEPRMDTLRKVCERAQAAGHDTLIIAYDHFFAQYRPGQGDKPRELTPDRQEFVDLMATISKFVEGYGLGLELSILSPLEIGPAYQKETGESGIWYHARKGLRDPATGKYSVQYWRHHQWANNKGPIKVEDAGVRVFAFRERNLPGTRYRVVEPGSLVEITPKAKTELLGNRQLVVERVQVSGEGMTDIGDLNRVLVVQAYRTPEMDYFSDNALPYLKKLVDRYADAGVKLHALYSDEMHIQQDWSYFSHHDHGEFPLRYASPGLIDKFSRQFGEQYRDFAQAMIYFVHGQEDFAHDLSAKADVMHVLGSSVEDIQRTALFRANYYRFLQDGVVDLFAAAKRHAEERMGYKLHARAHATWAESPTIDEWWTGKRPKFPQYYEYTPNFVWSNTVHQAASACFDYFKWGDFLTGNGNDHAEGGWIDRNYYAQALACSTGLLNEVPYSYAAHWGMPGETGKRRANIVNAFGTAGSPDHGLVQGMRHRAVDVLMLYPIDLVGVDERFGSWMTQYGYADMTTQTLLVDRGRVEGSSIVLGGRRFTTLATQFEPFLSTQLLAMMERFVAGGGRLIWSGPPPILTREGEPALPRWSALFGVEYTPWEDNGVIAPGEIISFEGSLQSVSPQTILTDLLVDRLYPVAPLTGTETGGRAKAGIVATVRRTHEGGSATYLGYRPRDDQSASLGYETRNWFEVLSVLGAYTTTGGVEGANDNTEFLSRTSDYVFCRFVNGAVSVARHFRDYEEGWPGGFARKPEQDLKILESHPLPSESIDLVNILAAGRRLTYHGSGTMSFRLDDDGHLIGFAGEAGRTLVTDEKQWDLASEGITTLAFAPVDEVRRVPGGPVIQARASGTGQIRIPILAKAGSNWSAFAEGARPGSRGVPVAVSTANGQLLIEVVPEVSGRWLFLVPNNSEPE